MEIVLEKDPFDYRRFKYILIFDKKKLDNNDASMLGRRVCAKLTEKTKMQWGIEVCVGGKCTIMTKLIGNRNQRKKWNRQKIVIDNVPFLR
jgi:hypothetical protein